MWKSLLNLVPQGTTREESNDPRIAGALKIQINSKRKLNQPAHTAAQDSVSFASIGSKSKRLTTFVPCFQLPQ